MTTNRERIGTPFGEGPRSPPEVRDGMWVRGAVHPDDPRKRVGEDGASDGRLPWAELVGEVGGAFTYDGRFIEFNGRIMYVGTRDADEGVAERRVVRPFGEGLPDDGLGHGGNASTDDLGVVALPGAVPRGIGETETARA